MSTFNIVLLTVGAVVLAVGLFSAPIKRSFLSVPLVALLTGVLLSPAVSGVLDPSSTPLVAGLRGQHGWYG